MRFFPKHIVSTPDSEKVLLIEWNSQLEYYVHRENFRIYNWNGSNNDNVAAKTLPFKPVSQIIDIDCMNVSHQNVGDQRKRSSEIFAVGLSDGKCFIVHKSGRTERVIDGHKGAVLKVKWNHDGTGLLTSGEDGSLKIWSRSGMLRSTLTQTDSPIYSAAWSSFSLSILYSHGKMMTIQPFTSTNSKTFQWRAHDSVILTVAWSPKSNLIASGSEDCRYKIWDSRGQMLFNSTPQAHPINCIAWSPSGMFCAFTNFSTICITNSFGNTLTQQKVQGNGISSVCWSPDESRIAVGNSEGSVEISHLIQSDLAWKNYEVTMTSPNILTLRDILNDTTDILELKDDVVLWSFQYGYLLAASQLQCFIFKENNWNCPITVDLRDKCPQFLKQCEKYFLVLDCGILQVYSYDGASLGTPKVSQQRLVNLTADLVTSSKELVVLRSSNDGKTIQFSQLRSDKSLYGDKVLSHNCEVVKLELDPHSTTVDQMLALLDTARDVFLVYLPAGINKDRTSIRIASGVSSFKWNCSCSMLALIREQELCIVPYPPALFYDMSVMEKFAIRKTIREYGKNLTIDTFDGNRVILRRGNGQPIPIYISPYPHKLQEYAVNGQWENAQRLCSSIKTDLLWVCLAVMAVHFKQLDPAQIAYAALGETDKILYIDSIKKTSNAAVVKAETALLQSGLAEAEAILLQAALPAQAIMINLQMFNFDKALDLAIKHNTNIDAVLTARHKYLEQFGWSETIPRFIEYTKKVNIDSDTIEETFTKTDK